MSWYDKMEDYERTTLDAEEARRIAKETGGKITTFLTVDGPELKIVTCYRVTYPRLF